MGMCFHCQEFAALRKLLLEAEALEDDKEGDQSIGYHKECIALPITIQEDEQLRSVEGAPIPLPRGGPDFS